MLQLKIINKTQMSFILEKKKKRRRKEREREKEENKNLLMMIPYNNNAAENYTKLLCVINN
jgi:hypothetical protein